MLLLVEKFQIEKLQFFFFAIGFRWFHVVLGCRRLLYNVSLVLGCATLFGFIKLFLL